MSKQIYKSINMILIMKLNLNSDDIANKTC